MFNMKWKNGKLMVNGFTIAKVERQGKVYRIWIGDEFFSKKFEDSMEKAIETIECELGICRDGKGNLR